LVLDSLKKAHELFTATMKTTGRVNGKKNRIQHKMLPDSASIRIVLIMMITLIKRTTLIARTALIA
jgi:hypothetical protein